MTSDCPVPNLFPGAEGVAIAIFQISVFAIFLMLFRSVSGRKGGRNSYLSKKKMLIWLMLFRSVSGRRGRRKSYLSRIDNIKCLMLFRSICGRRGGRRSYLSNIDNLYVFDAFPICFGAQRGSQ